MFIKCHGAYLGSTGFNNHTRGFFRGLSKYAKVYVRNFTVDKNIDSYLIDVDKQILSEQTLWSSHKNNTTRRIAWKGGTRKRHRKSKTIRRRR